MKFERQNIFSLIRSGWYHSCVMTSFSFDFNFLELRAVRQLRNNGIKNINILVDGSIYSDLIRGIGEKDSGYGSGYSLYPIFGTTIFHPKIMMLFGKKHGLLVVGSGNLTFSGNGINDEIWGAFHFDLENSGHAGIFGSAWQYISELAENLQGLIKEKIMEWIPEQAEWVSHLPKPERGKLHKLPKGDEIALLFNREGSGIWDQAETLLEDAKVVEITTISPYYDMGGAALLHLKQRFPDADIRVLVDDSGTIPSEISNSDTFQFYDWKDCGVSRTFNLGGYSRLHGKLIHFKTVSAHDYILFGSANVTKAGLGLSSHANEEVSYFLKTSKKDLLTSLELDVDIKNRKSISDFKSKNKGTSLQKVLRNRRFDIKLTVAELMDSTIVLHTIGNYPNKINAVVCNLDGNEISIQGFEQFASNLMINPEFDIEEPLSVHLRDLNGNRISNSVLLNDSESLFKTHPRRQNERLTQLIDAYNEGAFDKMRELLSLALEEKEPTLSASSSIASVTPYKSDDVDTASRALEEYDIEEIRIHKRLLQDNVPLQILDAIKFRVAETQSRIVDLDEDDQVINLDEAEGRDDDEEEMDNEAENQRDLEDNENNTISEKEFLATQASLLNYIKRLTKYYCDEVLYKVKRFDEYKLTLTDIVRYSIFVELVTDHASTLLTIKETQAQRFYFRWHGSERDETVKKYCMSLMAAFIRLAGFGFEKYSYELTEKTVDRLKRDALTGTLAVILNIRWEDSERNYPLTMIFNALRYLGYYSSEKFASDQEVLAEEINERISRFNYVLKRKRRVTHWKPDLENTIFPAFLRSLKDRENKRYTSTIKKGDIVFWPPVGYASVKAIYGGDKYIFARPGFIWDDIYEDYCHRFNKDNTQLKAENIIRVKI